jgi:C-terminal processing protease CtpA/Prc
MKVCKFIGFLIVLITTSCGVDEPSQPDLGQNDFLNEVIDIMEENSINRDSIDWIIDRNPKVAVLINQAVASSGEALAISFIGRPNSRTFGTSTCGLSTSNQSFNLRDGYTLFLTTAFLADRNENIFGRAVIPEQEVNTENLIRTAVDYLR